MTLIELLLKILLSLFRNILIINSCNFIVCQLFASYLDKKVLSNSNESSHKRFIYFWLKINIVKLL